MSLRNRLSRLVAAGLLALSGGCVDTGQEPVSFPLSVAGTEPQPIAAGDWEVELSGARLAFGPLYLCANDVAGQGCEVARGQWLDDVVVDLLDASPELAGEIEAHEGEVRSFKYDVGAHWPLTKQQPRSTDAAEELDGASLRLTGIARRDDLSLPFEASVWVAPVGPGQVTSSGGLQPHAVAVDEAGLLLRFQPERTVSDIDFDQLLDADAGVPGAPVEIEEGTQAARAIAQGLVGRMRPSVEWGFSP